MKSARPRSATKHWPPDRCRSAIIRHTFDFSTLTGRSMSSETSHTLLVRLRDSTDNEAWNAFVDIYRGFIYNCVLRVTTSEQIAVDVTDEVVSKVAINLSTFSHSGRPGAFRCWLRQIAVNSTHSLLRKRRRQKEMGDVAWDQLAKTSDDIVRLWDQEHDRYVLSRALILLKEQNARDVSIFEQVFLGGEDRESVATAFGITRNHLNVIVCRVMKKLRTLCAEFIGAEPDSRGPSR